VELGGRTEGTQPCACAASDADDASQFSSRGGTATAVFVWAVPPDRIMSALQERHACADSVICSKRGHVNEIWSFVPRAWMDEYIPVRMDLHLWFCSMSHLTTIFFF
jgi:hypothetical protein